MLVREHELLVLQMDKQRYQEVLIFQPSPVRVSVQIHSPSHDVPSLSASSLLALWAVASYALERSPRLRSKTTPQNSRSELLQSSSGRKEEGQMLKSMCPGLRHRCWWRSLWWIWGSNSLELTRWQVDVCSSKAVNTHRADRCISLGNSSSLIFEILPCAGLDAERTGINVTLFCIQIADSPIGFIVHISFFFFFLLNSQREQDNRVCS